MNTRSWKGRLVGCWNTLLNCCVVFLGLGRRILPMETMLKTGTSQVHMVVGHQPAGAITEEERTSKRCDG